jgi:UPF0716 protein FxsA
MPALVLVAFLVVPLLELYVILQVADVIGGWQTLAVLVLESLFGTWLVRREGRRTWRAFSAALEARRSPTREVADGALVIVGGTLLLTPGFLTDIFGFFFLLPPTRPLARRLLLRFAGRRVGRRLFGAAGSGWGGSGWGGSGWGGNGSRENRPGGVPSGFGADPDGARRRGPRRSGRVIEGDVIDGRTGQARRRGNDEPPTP